MQYIDGLKLTVSVAVVSVVAVFFYRVAHGDAAPPATDRYGCVCGRAPAAHTLVFVDRTDAYSAGQIAVFRRELARIHAAVAPGAMLTVANIGGEIPAVINFRACSPEKGEVFGFAESFRRNQDWLELQRQYEQKFQAPIQKLAEEMPLTQTTRYSPIIQSMAGAIEQLGPEWSQVSKRSVTVISDLMENTDAFSQYDKRRNRQSFAEIHNTVPYIQDAPLDLRGAAVTVLYLTGFPHDRGLQGMENQKFWRDLIAFYGGELDDWIVVPVADSISR